MKKYFFNIFLVLLVLMVFTLSSNAQDEATKEYPAPLGVDDVVEYDTVTELVPTMESLQTNTESRADKLFKKTQGKLEYCQEIRQIANVTMDARQHIGENISNVVISNLSRCEAEIESRTVLKMIIESYKTPRYGYDVSKQIAIRQFGERMYLQCIEGELYN